MLQKSFDQWLGDLDLSFWGTAQHKITPTQARILDAGYSEFTDELKPGKVYKRTR